MNYSKLKRSIIVIVVLIAIVWAYVAFINRNHQNMNTRQKILNAFYPVIMSAGKLFGKKDAMLNNNNNVKPPVSFYDLSATRNDGTIIEFNQFKGKNVLLVNTASECGYTGQYADLEKLQQQFKGELIVVGFPANDFKNQEKGTDDEIATFCQVNFGVSFPLVKKSQVIKGADQNKIFSWLTDANQNGWCTQEPTWNFSKYLVSKEGILTNFFDQTVSPMDDAVIKSLK